MGAAVFARPAAGPRRGGPGGLRPAPLGLGPADRAGPSRRAAGHPAGDPGAPRPDRAQPRPGRRDAGDGRAAEGVLPARRVAEHGDRQGRRPDGSRWWDRSGTRTVPATRAAGPRSACSGSAAAWRAMEADFLRPEAAEARIPGPPGSAVAAEPPRPEEPPPAPTDSDTLLVASLEGLTDRFGQAPPQAVVVFSDGRARDPDRADAIARAYGRMKVPIHVFPAGEPGVGGDVAIVEHGRAEPGPQVLEGRRAGLRAELRLQGPSRRAEDRGRGRPAARRSPCSRGRRSSSRMG